VATMRRLCNSPSNTLRLRRLTAGALKTRDLRFFEECRRESMPYGLRGIQRLSEPRRGSPLTTIFRCLVEGNGRPLLA